MTNLYFIGAGVGIIAALVAIIAGARRHNNWSQTTFYVGAILAGGCLLQGLSETKVNSVPSYVREAQTLQGQLEAMETRQLAITVGELIPNSSILVIAPPILPEDEAGFSAVLEELKLKLPEGTLLSAVYHVPWPSGVSQSRGSMAPEAMATWWTAADLKNAFYSPVVPVNAVVCFMPLPKNLPASAMWKEMADWPAFILVNARPEGLETYISSKIIKAAIATKPGYNARAISSAPGDEAGHWRDCKVVITQENLAEMMGKYKTLFKPPMTPFSMAGKK